MRNLLLMSLLAAGALPAAAQRRAPEVSGATVERVLTTLAADDMQGRATGQPGSVKAADFLASEFQRIGLQPLPGATGFRQEFPAYQSAVTSASVTLDGVAQPASQVLALTTQPTLSWTEKDDVALLVLGPQDKVQPHFGEIFRPTKNTLVLLDPGQAALFKSLAERYSRPRLRAEPAGNPYSTVVVLASAPASPPAYRVAATTATTTLTLRNVAGYLPGHDAAHAAEKIIFSGHYDHLGILKPVAGDSIANGADDDASGTTAVVALAEYFKKRDDNARSLIFVAFTAEEIGGFGARYFSQQLDPKELTAMFNIEMIGKPAKFGPNTAFITGYDKSDFGQLLQANLKGTKFKFEPDPYPEQNLFYRSDNATLARLGVPAHTISTDQIPTDKLYHSVDDEVSSLDVKNMTAVISAIARSATGLVAGRQTPSRVAPESVAK
ncbi:M20/M25/M40 family metallo-hydrolase [Hymenobacter cheonanensis]|uniref:M20/M25/M40 family metallo-hydrolase n=1 Tax=Hymenobacter sp. CA2-7 TaxID=3063993 RepID=UPI0027127F9A|nr:M20/M25/M40 family metallo-hydrolase [Hymenobacter sp. CA2-7]MDO7886587.1 M20/M25/M40 family metallo-hydrolase [Hymenobacter sp. CA2-7]